MAADPFAFYRGTCHLFHEDWPAQSPLNDAPRVWACGDLHRDNFGTYLGDNRCTYFDINDFDEALLAPCTRDVARFIVSILLSTSTRAGNDPEHIAECHRFLRGYVEAASAGSIRWVERATAKGLVRKLLRQLRRRTSKDLLKRRTRRKGRRLRVDDKRTLSATEFERGRVLALLAAHTAPSPQQASGPAFRVLDVARRVAGLGSLGLERYIVLIDDHNEGGESRDDEGPCLLDLKQIRETSFRADLDAGQPVWRNEAERVVAVQRRVQAVPPAMLEAIDAGDTSFVLRELQPTQDRVALDDATVSLGDLEQVLETMGNVVAWGHLRGSGRQGAATADALIDFAHQQAWQREVVAYAQQYSACVRADWKEFRTAFRDGALGAVKPSGN